MTKSVDLSTRFGGGTSDPSQTDLEAALREVFHEDHPDLQEGDYVEHPSSWLTYGFQDGERWTVYTVDVYRRGLVIYSKMLDQDDPDYDFEYQRTAVSEADALRLWQLLAAGRTDDLDREAWEPCRNA